MIRPPDRGPRRAPRGTRSARIRALLSLGLLVGVGAIGTFAFWSDTARVDGGQITSGTMDLQFDTGGAAGLGTPHSRTNITWSGLAPGERKAFNLRVDNVGNPPFTYSATVTRGSTPAWTFVGTPITVQVFTGTAVPDTTYPQQDTCSGTAVGTQQAVDATNKAVVAPARPIAANTGEDLCIIVGLDAAATNDNQAKTGSIALDVTATQQ